MIKKTETVAHNMLKANPGDNIASSPFSPSLKLKNNIDSVTSSSSTTTTSSFSIASSLSGGSVGSPSSAHFPTTSKENNNSELNSTLTLTSSFSSDSLDFPSSFSIDQSKTLVDSILPTDRNNNNNSSQELNNVLSYFDADLFQQNIQGIEDLFVTVEDNNQFLVDFQSVLDSFPLDSSSDNNCGG
eukprot:Awhi_evm1s3278